MKTLLRLKPYLLKYKKTLLLGFLAIIASDLFTIVHPYILGKAVDELKMGFEIGNVVYNHLILFALLIITFSIIAGIFSFFTRQTIIVVSRHIEFDLRNDILSHLQKLHYSFFQNKSTGDLMSLVTNDISAVRNVLGPGIMYPLDTVVTLIFVLTMMFISNWELTLIALTPMPFITFAIYKLGKQINKTFTKRQEQYSSLTTHVQESLSGIRIIRSYTRETYDIDCFKKISNDYLKINLKLAKVQSIIWPLMFVLIGLSLILTIYFGGLKVINSTITIGTLTAFTVYLGLLIWPMIAFGWVINLLQQGAASMKRLIEILDTQPEIKNNTTTNYTIKKIEGNIEFKNVTFTHKNSNQPILENINLSIPKGKITAIVGYTGVGKSTLVNLIARLYDVTNGKILIDGNDIKNIPLEILREQIGFVPQETFLFSDTIKENIAYGCDNATEEKIIMASEISQISKDIKDFPLGLNTVIGERGITLSGGQKQRIAIARAIIKNPKILILDNSLSSVDTQTESTILKSLNQFMQNRTSIIVSHRISTIKNVDNIVVLSNNKIVEQGTHNNLLKLKATYAQLYKKQLLEKELNELQ